MTVTDQQVEAALGAFDNIGTPAHRKFAMRAALEAAAAAVPRAEPPGCPTPGACSCAAALSPLRAANAELLAALREIERRCRIGAASTDMTRMQFRAANAYKSGLASAAIAAAERTP